jgi:hypothetical protein
MEIKIKTLQEEELSSVGTLLVDQFTQKPNLESTNFD